MAMMRRVAPTLRWRAWTRASSAAGWRRGRRAATTTTVRVRARTRTRAMARTLTRQSRRLMVAAADRSAGGWWREAALCDAASVPLQLRVFVPQHTTRYVRWRSAGFSTITQPADGRSWTNGYRCHDSTPRNRYDTPHHCRARPDLFHKLSNPAIAAHTSLTLLTRVCPNTKHERDERTNSANWNGRHRADGDTTLRVCPRSSTRQHRV